jgi:hypothetical protein
MAYHFKYAFLSLATKFARVKQSSIFRVIKCFATLLQGINLINSFTSTLMPFLNKLEGCKLVPLNETPYGKILPLASDI